MIPVCKILIFNENKYNLVTEKTQLEKSLISFLDNNVDYQVIDSNSKEECFDLVSNDGDVQSIILSLDLKTETKDVSKFLNKIQEIRSELPLYIISDDEMGMKFIEDSNDIESYFFKNDLNTDPDSIIGYIINDYRDRIQTPFWTTYKQYVVESNDSWHTPGHSGGSSFRNSPYIEDFYHFYGRNVFAGDLSVSVDFLGSLSDSSNLIGKAQEAAAYTFEVNKTYFVTNGSSTSNKIILQTLLRSGDKVIIDRNCHKSVHYGILQACAYPLYLNSVYNPELGIFSPPTLSEIKKAIETQDDIKLIVLTGCTYEGLLIDLKQVVDAAHAKGIKVFIDEAWFAYSLFHPRFRKYSAIHSGADYITHSAHKVVSAFSQASYIHVNDDDFDEHFFKDIYNMYTSTSPKYQIIASLDVCHKQLEMEGYKILNNLLSHVDELKSYMSTFKKIRILGPEDFSKVFSHYQEDNLGHDPLKILIDISKSEYSVHEIHRYLLDEIGLEIEKYTHSTILVLLTLGGTRSKVIRLYNALKKLEDGKVKLNKSKTKKLFDGILPPIKLETLPSEAFFSEREILPFEETEGRICAGLVTPYPPGIPALVPGQLITKEHINYIRQVKSTGLTMQGVFDGEIYVKK